MKIFLWISVITYMWYPLTMTILIFLQQLSNFYGTNKMCYILLCQDQPLLMTYFFSYLTWGTPNLILTRQYHPGTFHPKLWSLLHYHPWGTLNVWSAPQGTRLGQLDQMCLWKNDKNSDFGIPTDPFTHSNLPITIQFIQSVLAPATKNINDNIYHYCPFHSANSEPQVTSSS